MGILLIILQVLGALPSVIELAIMVWDQITKIKDRNKKRAAKMEFRRTIMKRHQKVGSRSSKVMTHGENDELLSELRSMSDRVQEILIKEEEA